MNKRNFVVATYCQKFCIKLNHEFKYHYIQSNFIFVAAETSLKILLQVFKCFFMMSLVVKKRCTSVEYN